MASTTRSIAIGTAAGLALMATIACSDHPPVTEPAPPAVTAPDVDPGPGVTDIGDAPPLMEDSTDPAYDCRTMGNHECGVIDTAGRWYVITFDDDGNPTGARVRQ